MVEDVGVIVGGCVAGGLILIVLIGITVYLLFCKKKHRKGRDQNKFHPISPHTSPSHSQPSTVGPDGRLPKVNSTGLWMGAPSMYSGAAPSPAYYYGPNKQVPPPPVGFLSRASSETRIPNNGYAYTSSQPIYGSHGNLIMTKKRYAPPPPPRRAASLPKVPIIGMQPRIYHSSQPLAPVFEVPPHSNPGMEIYDVYQFAGGTGHSKSKLVETKHSKFYYDEGVKPNPKLARSKSDLDNKVKGVGRSRSRNSSKPAPKVARSSSSSKQHRPPPPPSHHRSSSKEIRLIQASPFKNSQKSKSMDSLGGSSNRSFSSHYNQGFDAGGSRVSSLHGEIILRPAPATSHTSIVSGEIVSSRSYLPNGVPGTVSTSVPDHTNNNEIHPSATDSMKLLAKNKTDDQKTVIPPSSVILPSKDDGINIVEDKEMSTGHVHYIYHGDIYAVPGKNDDDPEENPILSRMKEMVIEKARSSSTKSHSSYNDLEKSAPNNSFVNGIDSEYQEIATQKTNDISLPDTGIGSADTQKDSLNELDFHSKSIDSVIDSTDGLDILDVPTSPVKYRDNGSIFGGSDITDATSEDINNAGKRITDSAFEFLNTYLSDDDGEGHVDSPPISP